MVSIVSRVVDGSDVYGVDTETYNDKGHMGLKSIQCWAHSGSVYLTSDDFTQSDNDIRSEICNKFFTWLSELQSDTVLAFFNLDFDFSQIVKNLVQNSPWEYVEKSQKNNLRKGTFSILESDSNIYRCDIKTESGIKITFIDIANFLTATTLNRACMEWLGECKLDLPSKIFPKRHATEKEISYAMKDAELTCKLYHKLNETSVIENINYVTIAGRTMGHFKDFLKSNFSMTFEEFCYGVKDKRYAEMCNYEWEEYLRESLRGGVCMAVHKGWFTCCKHVDAVSMYPTQMVKPKIPFGPVLNAPPIDRDYTTIHFPTCYLTLKRGKIPYIQWNSNAQCQQYQYKKLYKAGEYVSDCYLDGSHAFWHDEWEIIQECYNIKEFSDKPVYVQMKNNTALREYITMLFEGKKNNKGTKRYFYKILMNSLYGKFLSRPDGKRISYEGGERHTVEENDKRLYYLPLGSWIAMSGRVTLFKVLLSLNPKDVLYCDTDSCIFTGDKLPDVEIGKNLGQWEIENTDFDVWIVGPKTYQELNYKPISSIPYNPLNTKCAGINADVRDKIKFAELKEGGIWTVTRAHRDKETWAKNVVQTPYEINCRVSVLHG
nr:MAG TPA: DNA polymerase B [Caudoviricetes sp.]